MMRAAAFGLLVIFGFVPIASAQTTLVRDEFSGANNASIAARTPDTTNLPGGAWTVLNGNAPTISSNKLRHDGGPWALAVIDAGTPDATVSVHWTPGTSNHQGAIAFRVVDAANYFYFELSGDWLRLHRVIDGQASTPWNDPLNSGEGGGSAHTLSVTVSGDHIELSFDGAEVFETWDATHITARRFGLRLTKTQPRFDDFTITGLYPPTPASVQFSTVASTMVFGGEQVLTALAKNASGVTIAGMAFDWVSSNPARATVVPTSINTARVYATGLGPVTITAIPVRGPQGAAPITVFPGNWIIHDTFSGTNATSLTNHSPDVNQLWGPWTTSGGGTRTLLNNRLKGAGAAGATLIDGGTADGILYVTWFLGESNGAYAGLIFRATDADNYFLFEYSSSLDPTMPFGLTLWKRQNGQLTQVWRRDLSNVPSNGVQLKVTLQNSTISVDWNGGAETYSAENAFNATATRYGLYWNGVDQTSTYDDFKFNGTLPNVPAMLTLTPASAGLIYENSLPLDASAFDAFGLPMKNFSVQWSSSNPAIASFLTQGAWTATVRGEGIGTATITASAVPGPTVSATVTVSPGNNVTVDKFVAPANTLLVDHVPVVNQMSASWTVTGTLTPYISGNAVQAQGPAGGDAYALVEGGTPNGQAEVFWTPGPNCDGGFLFRATDAENLFLYQMKGATAETPTHLALWRRKDGLWTLLWSTELDASECAGGQRRFTVVLNGPNIELWDVLPGPNATPRATIQNTFNQYATQYGFRPLMNAGSYTWFRVTGTLPPTVDNLAVEPQTVELAPFESVTLNALMTNGSGQTVAGAIAAWRSGNTTVAKMELTGASIGRVSAAAIGTTLIAARVPRGTAPEVTVPVTVRICVDPFTSLQYAVPNLSNSATFAVSAGVGCTWQAVSLDAWIAATATATSGNGSVTLNVAENTTVLTRVGRVAVGGRIIEFVQLPRPQGCAGVISVGQTHFSKEGGDASFAVGADPNCHWTAATSDEAVVHALVDGGAGNGSVSFKVLPNPGPWERTASIMGVTVTQDGGPCSTCEPWNPPPPPTSCTYDTSSWSNAPESGVIQIWTQRGCPWTASSSVPEVTLSQASGTGPALVSFVITPNFTSAVNGEIHIASNYYGISTVPINAIVGHVCVAIPVRCNPEAIVSLCFWQLCGFLLPPETPPPGTETQSPTLTGQSQVLRGTTAAFTVTGGEDYRNWRFTPSPGSGLPPIVRDSNTGNRTWLGQMVTSGTVSVEARYQGNWQPLSLNFTALPRPNFALPPVLPDKVANGSTAALTLPDPPQAPPPGGVSTMGRASLQHRVYQFSEKVPSGSPNTGLWFLRRIDNTSTYQWVIPSQLDLPSAQFYQAQCGNYNEFTNPLGFISGSQLRANVYEHEAGFIRGHYANYLAGQANPANNLGLAAEGIIGARTLATGQQFANVVLAELTPYADRITQATAVEECDGHVNNNALTCVFQGHVNFPPYKPFPCP